MRRYVLPLIVTAFVSLAGVSFAQPSQPSGAPKTTSLDYEYFKARVQPILAAKREGLTRCVTCHKEFPVATAFHMEPPGPDGTWTEAQSRQNFDMVSRRVVPGNVTRSLFLIHPLRSEAGGDRFHFGGKHFVSTADPEWQIMKSWVLGAKLGS